MFDVGSNRFMKFDQVYPRSGVVIALVAVLLWPGGLNAAPFDEQISFKQPDGTVIQLHGWGDEFHATFETLDGFTVLFDQAAQAYCYARQEGSGELVSLGVQVQQGNPVALGLAKHERMSAEVRKKKVLERWQHWEDAMQIQTQWEARKTAVQQVQPLDGTSGGDTPISYAPPSFTTTGTKVGLTLLVDFSDAPATVARSEIVNFCNGDAYSGYGNNGSVKKYFYDNSGGLLTYSNVVTLYVRVPHPKSYYDNTTQNSDTQGNLLIKDALDTIKAMTNYATDILPTFSTLTVNASNQIVAFNVYYAGFNNGVWSKGLWAHSAGLAIVGTQPLGNGMSVNRYQLSYIGDTLALGTFCHENGHMLCGYPDIYDYDYDSEGGAGRFCLMNSGGHGINPVQICAYLKRASGWTTTVEMNSNSFFTATAGTTGTNFNRIYRYAKPGASGEYFLIENRQKTGHDANLPGSGLAIWHIDQAGDHNNQSTNFNSSHLNYEVTLVQADNLYHFQRYVNDGDANDLFYQGNTSAGYANEFTDNSTPSARWWDGTPSGIHITDISASSATMTFRVSGVAPPLNIATTILSDGNGNGTVDYNETNLCWVVLRNDGGQTASNIVAKLGTATANVFVVQNTSAYPNVAPGQLVTNSTPFLFYTSPAFVCGTQIQFTNTTTSVGRTNTGVFTRNSGLPASPLRYDNNTPVAIQDNGTTLSTNLVSGFGSSLGNVTISLYLTHTYDSDLLIDLISPDGSTNILSNRRGSKGDNYGSAATPDSSRTTFDDAATTPIANGSAPFVGSYKPDQPFTVHLGKSGAAMNGPWVLRVRDLAGGDTGTLQAWSLKLTPTDTCVDGGVQPVSGTLVSPTNNQVFTSGAPVSISSTATDLANSIVRVVFFDGASVLATSTVAPYTFTWTNAAPGLHAVSAQAVNSFGQTASASAMITVVAFPAITSGPEGLTVTNGAPATFSVLATGGALQYQWLKNGSPLIGGNSNAFTIPATTVGDAGGYQVVVSNVLGSVTSSVAPLTVMAVLSDLKITGQLLSSGDVCLSFVGQPGASYALDRSFNLTPPLWEPQETNLAAPDGSVVFTNAPSPATNNFWRIRSVP